MERGAEVKNEKCEIRNEKWRWRLRRTYIGGDARRPEGRRQMSNPQSLATPPCFQTSTGMEGAQNTPSIPIPFYIKICSACRHPELRETSYARNPLRGIQQRLSNKSAATPASLRSAAPSKGRGKIDHLIPSHQPLVTKIPKSQTKTEPFLQNDSAFSISPFPRILF